MADPAASHHSSSPRSPSAPSSRSPEEEEPEEDPLTRLCHALFQWTCVNCTRQNAAHVRPEMMVFTASVARRLEAQRKLAQARAQYAQQLRPYLDAQAAAAATPPPARDQVLPVPSAAQTASTSPSPETQRRSALASIAAAIGLTVAPVQASPPQAPLSEPPPPPDFAAMIAALPAVAPVPSLAQLPVGAEMCESCGAPRCAESVASPPVVKQLMTGDNSDEADTGAEASSSMQATQHEPVNTNMSVLMYLTLQDEDPEEYLSSSGLTGESIGAILSGAAAGGSESCTSHAGRDGAPAPCPPTIAAQKRACNPTTQTLHRGFGGFAPVTAIVYDDRMLLHEEVPSGERGGLRIALPGVQLPHTPSSHVSLLLP